MACSSGTGIVRVIELVSVSRGQNGGVSLWSRSGWPVVELMVMQAGVFASLINNRQQSSTSTG